MVRVAGGEVEVFSTVEPGAGSARPVLLVMPPFNLGAGVFAEQFGALEGECDIVAVHRPGVGGSTVDDVSLAGIGRLYEDVLAALGVTGRVHVLGASVGSIFAQRFALDRPERTASLILVGGSYRYANRDGELNELSVVVEQDLAALPLDARTRALRGRQLLDCESMNPRIGLRYLDFFAAAPDLRERLSDIGAPTLIVQGARDTVIPSKTAHLLHALIPDARYAELPDAGHFPYVTHPDEMNRLLVEFLADVTSGVPG